ncbi:MAG: hypothetical protein HGB05_08960, partial [Chloroflexi bacterium]|nr:hypothetical protein [Chloroflexota bacterium]
MSVFKDSQQFYDTVGELLQRAARDPNIGPTVARAETVIQLRYTDPEAQITIDARGVPTQFGAYVDVHCGPCDLQPEVVMSMTGDLAHEFWSGRVNLASALARRQIQATGPVIKVLRLVPAVEPLYQQYPVLLKTKGLQDLILKQE